ncbi:MAG: DUF3540 domain-containing protein [Alcaligenaceae bacterium]|nr:DUF3540 domain-containing protein [Alcaligenaceae bacterium]
MSASLEQPTLERLTPTPTMTQAILIGQTENWFFLQSARGESRARCAVSCLLVPEIGDTVLLSASEDPMSSYILAILLRPTSDHSMLKLPGGATMSTAQGQLSIQAASVCITGEQALQFETSALKLNASEAEIRIRRLHGWFEQVQTYVDTLKLVAKNTTATIERRLLRARESFKWIEQVDETRAGRIRLDVKGRLQVQSRHTSIKSEGFVSIDGKKINLG